ncbi:hypothetical protein Tco_1504866 [Tanacetum coccineum]
MVVLESCPKHNMVTYLEKTEGNAEFHLSIMLSLYITAKVAGKPVSISEKASIRSDLLFDYADGIDSLPNQAIFDAIQLMGYEGDLTVLTFNKVLFSPQWRFLFHTMNHYITPMMLVNVPVPLDHFPVNALTSKVFSFMVKKGKHFSGKVTPSFASMLVQSTEDEGATSERPSEPQPTPSPPHPSEANIEPQSDPSPRPSPTSHIPDSIPEVSGGNHGDQAKEIKHLKAQLKMQAKLIFTHHRAWMKSVSLKQRLAGKKSLKSNWMQKEPVSKQGRNSAKVEPSGTEDAVSTEDVVSTDKEKVSTDKSKVSTDRLKDSTDKEEEGTDKEKDNTVSLDEGTDDRTKARSTTSITSTTTPTMFRDDETIAHVLLNMSQAKAVSREKEKGVELKDVEETERARPTSTRLLLTLKPLPKIDKKDKGKKKIEEEDESDTESEDIPEAEKKFKQLARDEEMA